MPDLLGVSVFVANHVTYVLMCQETSGFSSKELSFPAKQGIEAQVIALDCSL